jgi:RNA polymerase sigma factor (sigma-70 family)
VLHGEGLLGQLEAEEDRMPPHTQQELGPDGRPQDEISQELLERFKAGDAEAMDRLYRIHSDGLMAFASSFLRTKDQHLLDDIDQEVWLAVISRAWTYKPGKSFEGWLMGITRNACREACRWKSRHPGPLEEDAEEVHVDLGAPVTDLAHMAERSADIADALEGLHPETKEMVLLYAQDGVSFSEIARRTKLSDNEVRSRILSALATLRGMLSKWAPEDQEEDGRDDQ